MNNLFLYAITLVSVASPDDTITHDVWAVNMAHAIEQAHSRSGHWYTDVKSVASI